MLFSNKNFDKLKFSNTDFLVPLFSLFFLSLIIISIFGLKIILIDPSLNLYITEIFFFFTLYFWIKKLDTKLKAKLIIVNLLYLSSFISLFFLTIIEINSQFQFVSLSNYRFDSFLKILFFFSIIMSLLFSNKERDLFHQINNNDIDQQANNGRKKKFIATSFLQKIPYYKLSLVISILLFILVRLFVLTNYDGSYSDEYYHTTSGIEYINSAKFAEIYTGEEYARESYYSLIVGGFILALGKASIVVKLVPFAFGVINLMLLIFIAHKIYKKRPLILLLIYTYTFFPLVLFNHFYSRFYVVLEFIILLITAFFCLYKKDGKYRYIYGILFINILFLYFYKGATSNLINAFSLFLLISDQALHNSKFYLSLYYKFKRVIQFALVPLLLFTLLSFNYIEGSFKELLFGKLKYANSSLNYTEFFFSTNFILTASVLISSFYVARSNNKLIKPIFISFILMTTLHLISNPDSHTLRAIFYLMPLYLLFSFYILNINIKNFEGKTSTLIYSGTVLFMIFIGMTVIKNYPQNFFQHPYIHSEIMYYDNSVYKVIKDKCFDAKIITANRPEILQFFNIRSDYYLNTQYANTDWVISDPESKYSRFDSSTNSFFYNYTNTPVITQLQHLETILNENNQVCLLTGFMPYDWIDKSTREYIVNNLILQHTGVSSTQRNALRLYTKF